MSGSSNLDSFRDGRQVAANIMELFEFPQSHLIQVHFIVGGHSFVAVTKMLVSVEFFFRAQSTKGRPEMKVLSGGRTSWDQAIDLIPSN